MSSNSELEAGTLDFFVIIEYSGNRLSVLINSVYKSTQYQKIPNTKSVQPNISDLKEQK